jgi:hypothetical protein
MRAKNPASIVAVAQPTVRQIYALAAALCERAGEEFPETRDAASETIERLRTENGRPQPRLEDVPLRPRRPRRRGRGADRLASIIAKKLAEELRTDFAPSSSGSAGHFRRRPEPSSGLLKAAPQAEPR